MTEQPHGMTTTRDDNGATLRLLLPCQLTCALPSQGVDLSMTCGCTLHGFLTCETPCTPLPVPADYPDPCRGYGFLEGTGIGHREVTRGLPVPITSEPSKEIHKDKTGVCYPCLYITLNLMNHRHLCTIPPNSPSASFFFTLPTFPCCMI